MNWYGYIYKTVNLLNGKIYIGRRKGPFDRSYHGSGEILKKAIKLNGAHSFKTEVLSFAASFEELCEMERQHIWAYRESVSREMMYNISDGGIGGFTGGRHSNETKHKFTEQRTGKKNPMYGVRLIGPLNPMWMKTHSDSARRAIGYKNSLHRGKDHGNFGKTRSLETRLKISSSKKGNSPAWHAGKKLSAETREKISIAAKKRVGALNPFFGKRHSEETKKKISDTKKGLKPCV